MEEVCYGLKLLADDLVVVDTEDK